MPRKKTPTKTLRRRGSLSNKGKHRGKPRGEDARLENRIPDPPPWLSSEGAEHWERLGALVLKVGVSDCDGDALALVCEALARYEGARAQADGETVATTLQGSIVKHPSVTVLERAWQDVLKGLDRFGLNPSSRAALKRDPPETVDDEDPAQKYFPTIA